MDILPDVYALTEFRENAAEHVRRLKKTKRATLLTQKGRAAAVIMSPEAYEKMAEAVELARSIQSVQKSMKEFEQGKGMSVDEAFGPLLAKYAKRAARR